MQLIAETYDLLRHGAGLEVAGDRASASTSGTSGDLESFLIEITARVLGQDRRGDRPAAGRRDRRPGRAEGHRPLDRPGRARARRAADRHHRGRLRALAVRAARTSARPPPTCSPGRSPAAADASLVDDIEHALYASKIVAYAQGFEQMAAAAETEGWDLDLGAMATIWRGGCIIRARFLDRIREAYDDEPGPREPDARRLLPRRAGRRAGPLAAGDRARGRDRASRRRRSPPRWPTTTATGASAARRT